MLTHAHFQDFSTLPNQEFTFGQGLNVVIAENGLGKTHLLQALYCLTLVSAESGGNATKLELQKAYADKLVRVFRPDTLGRLVKRRPGRTRCKIELTFNELASGLSIRFATNATSSVQLDKSLSFGLSKKPVYLPTRELISLTPWFVGLYDNTETAFEETWRDTCGRLMAPAVTGPRRSDINPLLTILEDALGGRVETDAHGRFSLKIPGEGKMEINLVSEGQRKLATLARLISSGELLDQGYLFWDEPEANLNPRLIRVIANVMMELAAHGIQLFVASHSLFLLKELEILSQVKNQSIRYFSLSKHDDQVRLEQGNSLTALDTILTLDEELAQFDREQDAKYANGN